MIVSQASTSTCLDTLVVKQRLMYLDIRMICLLEQCLAQAKRVTGRLSRDVELAVEDYKQGIPIGYSLKKIDRIFEDHLALLYGKRTKLMESLFGSLPSRKLESSLREIDYELDGMVRALNMRGNVAAETIATWEKKVDLFQEIFARRCAKRDLKAICGKAYGEVVRKAEIQLLYLLWEKMVEEKSQSLRDRNTFWYSLQVKQLFVEKELFFEQFFLKVEHRQLAIALCSEGRNSQEILQKLEENIGTTQARITALEEKLTQSTGYLSSMVYTLIHNPYARNASFLVESQEMAMQTKMLRKVTFLSIPLQSFYLNLSKVMTTVGLFMLDIAEWKWVGVSHSMLYTMSQQLMPSSQTCIRGFKQIGCDEKTALLFLPKIRNALEFSVFTTIHSYSFGFNALSIVLSYTAGKVSVFCAGKMIDLLYRDRQSPSYRLIKGVAQWIAFPLAHRHLVPYFLKKLSPVELLMNEEACFDNREICKRQACQFLGVSDFATLQEIRKAYHQLALQYHPDKNPTGAEMFRKITFAKKMCGTRI